MAVEFNEFYTSRSADDQSVTVGFLATGAISTFDVRAAILADPVNFPEINGGLYINRSKTKIDQIEGLEDHFRVSATWENPTRQKEKEKREQREVGDQHWELATTSVAVHKTNSRSAKLKENAEATFEDTEDNVIGYSPETNEVIGADFLASVSELRLSVYLPTASVDLDFVRDVQALNNHTNDGAFLGFDVGTLLLTESRFSNDAQNFNNVRADYTFLIEKAITQVLEVLGSVTIPPHYHLDVQYETYTDEAVDPPRERKRPVSAKLHRIYDGGGFSILTATS